MYLSATAKEALETSIGKSIFELAQMDVEQEIAFVKSKTGKSPIFSKKIDRRMCSRGNPLIARKRICTMEDINKRIMELE